MKTHSVKSNAKRAARKLCERVPGLVAVEPLAVAAGGPWQAVVATAPGVDPSTLPAGTFDEVEFIAADGRIGAPVLNGGVTSAELAKLDPVAPGFADAVAETRLVADKDIATDRVETIIEDWPPAAAPEPAEIPAFLPKRQRGEPVAAGADFSTAPDVVTGNIYVGGKMIAEGVEMRVRVPKLDTAALAKSLPPRATSTPEEIEARREERRQRIAAEKANPTPKPAKAAKATKADAIVELARRDIGATNAEMRDATGWQAHTLRGFIAGTLRKRGHAFRLGKRADGTKAYYCDPAD